MALVIPEGFGGLMWKAIQIDAPGSERQKEATRVKDNVEKASREHAKLEGELMFEQDPKKRAKLEAQITQLEHGVMTQVNRGREIYHDVIGFSMKAGHAGY